MPVPVEVPERQTPRRDRQYQPADRRSVPYIQSFMEAPSQSVVAINTVHHHHRSARSQPNKQTKLSEAMGISHNVRQVYASCWKQWLRASFWLWGSQSCWFLYRHRQTNNYKHTQAQLCVLDWTVTRPEWLCQLCYVNYLYVEKYENSDPKLPR